MSDIREGWQNAFYRGTVAYIAVLVTMIFAAQMFRYFFDLPSSSVQCPQSVSRATLIPVIGVFFDG